MENEKSTEEPKEKFGGSLVPYLGAEIIDEFLAAVKKETHQKVYIQQVKDRMAVDNPGLYSVGRIMGAPCDQYGDFFDIGFYACYDLIKRQMIADRKLESKSE